MPQPYYITFPPNPLAARHIKHATGYPKNLKSFFLAIIASRKHARPVRDVCEAKIK